MGALESPINQLICMPYPHPLPGQCSTMSTPPPPVDLTMWVVLRSTDRYDTVGSKTNLQQSVRKVFFPSAE